ncbi:MAG: hypothetical protein QXD11_01375, partial [Candidatus Micrarchaeaceae archaeon]
INTTGNQNYTSASAAIPFNTSLVSLAITGINPPSGATCTNTSLSLFNGYEALEPSQSTFYFNFSSGSAVLLGSSEASPLFELGFFEYPHLSHCSWPCGCLFGICLSTCWQNYYIENWSGIASNSWENYATSNLLSNLPVRSTEYVNYIPGVTISGPLRKL